MAVTNMNEQEKKITVEQLWEGADVTLTAGTVAGSDSNVVVKYVVKGTDDELVAARMAYAAAPQTLEDEVGTIPIKSTTIESRAGEDSWIVKVEYSHEDTEITSDSDDDDSNGEDSNIEVCFQCNNGTIHVNSAIEQSCVYSSKNAPKLNDASHVPIGWNGKFGADSSAAGVDIPTAEIREQYTRVLSYSKVRSSSYKRKVANCIGKVNDGLFHGWKRGEAMFMGASYTTPQRNVKKVKVTFDFSIRLNENNARIAGIKVGDKKGHEYIWAVTSGAYSDNTVSPVIQYIFKSQVVSYANFSFLW